MPSAYSPIFVRCKTEKTLLRTSGLLSGLRQSTQSYFLSETKIRPDLLSELLRSDQNRHGSIVGLRPSNAFYLNGFCRTRYDFYSRQIVP